MSYYNILNIPFIDITFVLQFWYGWLSGIVKVVRPYENFKQLLTIGHIRVVAKIVIQKFLSSNNFFFKVWFVELLSKYIYIYICVCVCVCVFLENYDFSRKKDSIKISDSLTITIWKTM